MKMLKKVIVLLAVILYVGSLSVFASQHIDGELIDQQKPIDKDEIKDFAIEYLKDYWWSQKGYSYEELEKKFLAPSNKIFNEEMKVRVEYDFLRHLDSEKNNEQLISEELNIIDDLEITKAQELYVVEGRIDKYYNLVKDNKDIGVSADATDIVLKIKEIDGKLYLWDLIDRTSVYFNKDQDINLNRLDKEDELRENSSVPYGVNFLTGEEKLSENNKSLSAEEIETIQLENIESAREALLMRASVWDNQTSNVLNESPDYDIVMRNTGQLNRTKARNYARKWATTSPYCDIKRYIHIPTEYPGNFDCANFASQVLHEANAPFTSDDISKRERVDEWFALRKGTKYTYAWADAKLLKEFIINNTKVYGKKGPIYTRATWFDRGEDNNLYPGDLIFLCEKNGPNNGSAGHTLICTDEGGRNVSYYCAHNANEKDKPLHVKLRTTTYPKAVGLNIAYRY